MKDEGTEICHRHADDPDDDAVQEQGKACVPAGAQDSHYDDHVVDTHPEKQRDNHEDIARVLNDFRGYLWPAKSEDRNFYKMQNKSEENSAHDAQPEGTPCVAIGFLFFPDTNAVPYQDGGGIRNAHEQSEGYLIDCRHDADGIVGLCPHSPVNSDVGCGA